MNKKLLNGLGRTQGLYVKRHRVTNISLNTWITLHVQLLKSKQRARKGVERCAPAWSTKIPQMRSAISHISLTMSVFISDTKQVL
jgi:hypothetical protein